MAIDKNVTILPKENNETPVSDEDLALIRASLDRTQPDMPVIKSPVSNAPLPFAPNEMYAENHPSGLVMSDATGPTAPYPEPGAGAIAAGTLSGIPFLGPFMGKAQSDIAKKKQQMIDADTKALEFFDKIMKENPRQAGVLAKSPMFRDALVRQHGASDDDIMNISKVLSDPKLSIAEQQSILASGGMLDEKGSIVPRPLSIEVEKKMEREDYDKFEKAALAANKDMSEFDAMMLWNTKGKTGAQSKGWGAVAVGGRAFIYDKDTGKTVPFEGFKRQEYASYPVLDENGFPQGIVIVAKEAPMGTSPNDVPYGYFDFRTEVMKDAPPKTVQKIVGDKDGVLKRMNDWLIENFGTGAALQSYAIPEEQVVSGDVEMPNPENVQYAGPATNQGAPSAAELEAAQFE